MNAHFIDVTFAFILGAISGVILTIIYVWAVQGGLQQRRAAATGRVEVHEMRMLGPSLCVEMLETAVREKLEREGVHPVRVNIYAPAIDIDERNWMLVVQSGESVAQVELPILANFNLSLNGFMQRVLAPAAWKCKELLSEMSNVKESNHG